MESKKYLENALSILLEKKIWKKVLQKIMTRITFFLLEILINSAKKNVNASKPSLRYNEAF